MAGKAHRSGKREAAIVPAEHVANVVGIEQAAAGESAEHPVADPLCDGGDLIGGECLVGEEESDLAVFETLEYTVDDAAVATLVG